MKQGIIALLAILLVFVAGMIITYLIKLKTQKRDYDKIEGILQNYLSTETLGESDWKETRESKIISLLYQVLRMVDKKRLEEEQQKEEITRFLSDISHQVKTPLANIRVYLELLKEEGLTKEERKEFLDRIDAQSLKIEWLLKMLFQSSRLETGAIRFEVELSEITDTIQVAIDTVMGQAAKKQITIEMLPFPACEVEHNTKWTTEAILNILDNAIKYSNVGTKITIRFEKLSMYGQISITDQGIGIKKEEYTKIYQRFYRGEGARKEQGSGLGLYLSQLIVSLEGGYIAVDSKEGKGSTFSIFLPLRK